MFQFISHISPSRQANISAMFAVSPLMVPVAPAAIVSVAVFEFVAISYSPTSLE